MLFTRYHPDSTADYSKQSSSPLTRLKLITELHVPPYLIQEDSSETSIHIAATHRFAPNIGSLRGLDHIFFSSSLLRLVYLIFLLLSSVVFYKRNLKYGLLLQANSHDNWGFRCLYLNVTAVSAVNQKKTADQALPSCAGSRRSLLCSMWRG